MSSSCIHRLRSRRKIYKRTPSDEKAAWQLFVAMQGGRLIPTIAGIHTTVYLPSKTIPFRSCGTSGSLMMGWAIQALLFSGTENNTARYYTWWRHQMETFSALLAICAGNCPVNSPHKGQWRGALMFTLICARINGRVNNSEAGDLRRYRAHYDVIVMTWVPLVVIWLSKWRYIP